MSSAGAHTSGAAPGVRAVARRAALAALTAQTWLLARLPVAPRRPPPLRLGDARRILVVRLDELGDLVFTATFLMALRDAAPHARITLVVKPALRAMAERLPGVDEVLAFRADAPRWQRPVRTPWLALRLAATLRPRRFDVAFLPRPGADNSYATLLAFLTGARHRIGFSERASAHRRAINRGYDRYLTLAVRALTLGHDADQPLSLLAACGTVPGPRPPALEEAPDDAARAEALLCEAPWWRDAAAAEPASDGPLVAICPSPGHSALKQWPLPRFAELARRLHADHSARLVLVGGPGEAALTRSVADAVPAEALLDLTGRTSLPELAAVLRRCALYVGNDAGPLHVAAATGVPCVALFGSSDPERFGPYGAGHELLWDPPPCAPVFQPERPDRCARCIQPTLVCMERLTVDAALAACRRALVRSGAVR